MTLGSRPGVRRLRRRGDIIFYGAVSALFIGIGIDVAIGFAAGSGTGADGWLALAGILGIGISSAAFARTSVVLGADEPFFVVRNMYRRYEVPWSEVSGFETGTMSGPMVTRSTGSGSSSRA